MNLILCPFYHSMEEDMDHTFFVELVVRVVFYSPSGAFHLFGVGCYSKFVHGWS